MVRHLPSIRVSIDCLNIYHRWYISRCKLKLTLFKLTKKCTNSFLLVSAGCRDNKTMFVYTGTTANPNCPASYYLTKGIALLQVSIDTVLIQVCGLPAVRRLNTMSCRDADVDGIISTRRVFYFSDEIRKSSDHRAECLSADDAQRFFPTTDGCIAKYSFALVRVHVLSLYSLPYDAVGRREGEED